MVIPPLNEGILKGDGSLQLGSLSVNVKGHLACMLFLFQGQQLGQEFAHMQY